MSKSRFLILIGVILFISSGLLLLNGIGQTDQGKAEIKIAATIFPVYDIAGNIAGDKVKLVQVLPSGVSPHTFTLNVQQRIELTGTDVGFTIGLGFDNWVVKVLEDEGAEIVDLSEVVILQEDSDQKGGGNNPHYWLSISNAKLMAEAIVTKLSEVDPDNAAYFETNLDSYLEELEQLRARVSDKFEDLSVREIITFHDSFKYFAQEQGLEIVATIEPFPGKEPTASYLAEVGKIIERNQIKTLFKEPQLSDSIIQPLALDYGITLATLDPLGGVEGRMSYVELIDFNVDSIINALR